MPTLTDYTFRRHLGGLAAFSPASRHGGYVVQKGSPTLAHIGTDGRIRTVVSRPASQWTMDTFKAAVKADLAVAR
jgi:hypothetical protein